MLLSILILRQESGIPLFEYHFKHPDYELSMFSGLLTAIQSFCLEINIGDCNTFSSDQFQIITNKSNLVTSVLILEKEDIYTEDFLKDLSLQIAESFEKNYDLNIFNGRITKFKNFDNILLDILNKKGVI